ncbi:hypothetical protein DFJ74DRAFT_667985 [Hyaloraphidium curvatum]|nr:hypothetical protein DFJ74DRAFT_667985 [Hyaloraphidium curvatum]
MARGDSDAPPPRKARAPRKKAAAAAEVGDEDAVATVLVNRLSRTELERLLVRAIRDGAVPLADVRAALPEHRRALVPQNVDVVAVDLRNEAVGAFAGLPNEVQLLVFSLVPFRDRLRAAALVCRAWRQLLTVPTLWERCDFSASGYKPSGGFTTSGIKKLFGLEPGCNRTLDPNVVRQVRYRSMDGLSSNDIKKLFPATPNVVDIELDGISDHAVLQAAKTYAPNLRRMWLDSKVGSETAIKVLELNPGLEDYKVASADMSHELIARISRAGAELRPGGTQGYSRITGLSLISEQRNLDISEIAKLGTWFPELERLKLGSLKTHRSRERAVDASLAPIVPIPRLRTLVISVLLGENYTFTRPSTPPNSQETIDGYFRDLISVFHAASGKTLERLYITIDSIYMSKNDLKVTSAPLPPVLAGAFSTSGSWPKLRELGLWGVRAGGPSPAEKRALADVDAPGLRTVARIPDEVFRGPDEKKPRPVMGPLVEALAEATGARWRRCGPGGLPGNWVPRYGSRWQDEVEVWTRG